MENQDIINRNVLCPWNCSTSCHEAGQIPLDLIIQRMLPRVILPLYSGSKKYRLVHWTSNQYRIHYNNYQTMMLNDDWGVTPCAILDKDGLEVCICKTHNDGQDRMTLFPPRSPNDHIFNAEQADQLAPCVQVPRVTKSMMAMKYCTKFGMVQCRSGYNGTSTMNVTNHSDFSKTLLLLSEHEAACIVGRKDIPMLLRRKVANREITSEMADAFVNDAKECFTIEDLRKNTQGATYVKFEDMIRIQLFKSSSRQQICVVDDRPRQRQQQRQQKDVWVNRSWPILINLLQTEDEHGYGTQFCPIPPFKTADQPSAFAWTMFAMISSCVELWQVIDTKPTPFRWSGWEGWVLTAIQSKCFEFDSISVHSRSPIKRPSSLSDIASKINAFAPPELDDAETYGSSSFYKFHIDCFRSLFSPGDYANTIAVVPFIEEAMMSGDVSELKSKRIIIAVGTEAPSQGCQIIGGAEFELRVICVVRAKERGERRSHYDAVRYMRFGRGFYEWQKQERADNIVTHSLAGEELYGDLQYELEDCHFAQCVSVYVLRKDDVCVDYWRSKFFESMGGRSHVRCQCCQFPLIPTNRHPADKLKCNLKHYLNEGGVWHQTQHDCRRNETYVCSNVGCDLRVCNKCYNSFPVATVSTVIPPTSNPDEAELENDEHDRDRDIAGDIFNLVKTFHEDQDSLSGNEDGNNGKSYLGSDDDSIMDDFLSTSRQDTTLDLTTNNAVQDQGFLTMNAGDDPINVLQDPKTVVVGGHVIFNQAGKCTTRSKQTIEGNSRERYMVQSLCATSPGQASPLLQPGASLFTRHYYASAEHGECSILGAEPLFLLCSKTNLYGFASMLTHARMHMTNPFSTTSTDPNLMCLYFDMLGNMVMNKCHSRDIFQRGFVVDNKSAYGMSV